MFKPFPFSLTCLSTASEHIKEALTGDTWSWTSQSHQLWENRFLFSINLSSVEYSLIVAETKVLILPNTMSGLFTVEWKHRSHTLLRIAYQKPGQEEKQFPGGTRERGGREREMEVKGRKKKRERGRLHISLARQEVLLSGSSCSRSQGSCAHHW